MSQFDIIFLPVTVCGELLYGAENSQKAQKNIITYLDFIYSCEIMDTRLPVAWEYAHIKLYLKKLQRSF